MSSIHDKIRKLLAMAEGKANESESANAMKLASDLMMRHGIDESELADKKAEPTKAIIGDMFDLGYDWYGPILSAVGVLFGVKALQYKNGKATQFAFVGRRDNIEAAQDTFAFIILQVDLFYKEALPKGMSQQERGKYRKTFKMACAMRIYHRSTEIVREQVTSTAASNSTALVISGHRDVLSREIDDLFAGLEVRTSRARKVKYTHEGAMRDGAAAGSKVELNRRIG